MSRQNQKLAKAAFGFVLVIGIVNLFADLTYEGARSITGPFLGSLGASQTLTHRDTEDTEDAQRD
jgi:hypothetical protein